MGSRMRGMTVLSSTIIPRVQRLLETGVLKERPVWLDAVEAVPPLPPPTLPEAHKTGRCLNIVYPQDKLRKEESVKLRRSQAPPISLFESRMVKAVPQWSRTIAVMNFPPADGASMSHGEGDEIGLAPKTDEHPPVSEAVVVVDGSVSTSGEPDVATGHADTPDDLSTVEGVPLSDAEIVSGGEVKFDSRSDLAETIDKQSTVPLSDAEIPSDDGVKFGAGSDFAETAESFQDRELQSSGRSQLAESEAKSDVHTEHKQAKDNEEATMTVYVDIKGTENSEDSVIELLKKYEK